MVGSTHFCCAHYVPEWRVGQRTIVNFEIRPWKTRGTPHERTHRGQPHPAGFRKESVAGPAHLRFEFRSILFGINLLNPPGFPEFNLHGQVQHGEEFSTQVHITYLHVFPKLNQVISTRVWFPKTLALRTFSDKHLLVCLTWQTVEAVLFSGMARFCLAHTNPESRST